MPGEREGTTRARYPRPRASLVATHAGLGTVMASLAHGVPLICMPMGRDQDVNARRVQTLGAGVALPVDAGVVEIGQAVASVLQTPCYREGRVASSKPWPAPPAPPISSNASAVR